AVRASQVDIIVLTRIGATHGKVHGKCMARMRDAGRHGAVSRRHRCCHRPLLVNGEHMMPQRRTDEQTALTAEYALYLVDIRGVEFALSYLDTCNVSRSILTRALQAPELRRHHERRKQPRND